MISPRDHSFDVEFKFKEVVLFMEHFRFQSTACLAMMILKDLKRFLELGGDHSRVMPYLLELEAYSPKTANEDYVWELVYVRRIIARSFEVKKDYESAFEHALRSAKHFDLIVEIRPTTHNFCCRILEYLSAITMLENTKYAFLKIRQIKELYDYCRARFKEISEAKGNIYYETGSSVFLKYYKFSRKQNDPKSVSYDLLTSFIDCTVKHYQDEGDNRLLKNAMIAYQELSGYGMFSYEAEKERIQTVLGWANTAIENGADMLKESYEYLMKTVKKYEDSDCTFFN